MNLKEARGRLKDLAERMRDSAANLQTDSPRVSQEREKDADALEQILGDAPTKDEVCPTCGV